MDSIRHGVTSTHESFRRVLVVDDDPNILEGFLRKFRGRFEMVAASDATSALKQLRTQEPFAVLVSDLKMPGMDGIELLSRVREEFPTVVRIMLTGQADMQTTIDAVNSGHVFHFLLKPCSQDNLQQALKRAVAEHKRRVKEIALATEDALTGVGNRRGFDRAICRVHSHCVRHKRTYGLVMSDVDYFKRYNDRYGHLAGDELLQTIAHTLRDACRLSDELFRYGGEEFVFILPDTPDRGVMVACERFRSLIEALGMENRESESGIVTISFGAAVYDPGTDVPWKQVLDRADHALYQAKQQGRNCCRMWNESP